MTKTKIPYLDYTWTVTKGCSPISSGCQNCWANRMSKRLAGANIRGYTKEEPFRPTYCPWNIEQPLKIKKPSVIGITFMGDLFHDDILFHQINAIFNIIFKTPQHKYVILTKRPENIVQFIKHYCYEYHHLENVIFGVSIEDNKSLHNRIDYMNILKNDFELNTWVSIEPLLEYISSSFYSAIYKFDWIVCGSETGNRARYCDFNWIRKIYHICKNEDKPFYFKEWIMPKDYPKFNQIEYQQYLTISQTRQLPEFFNK